MRYAPERIDYAIQRYTHEVDRLLRVLERRFGAVEYVAGTDYSIADIAIYPGRTAAGLITIDSAEYPHTARWAGAVGARPGVMRGLAAERAIPDKYKQSSAKLSEAEWSNMFGARMHEAVEL